MVCEGTFLQLLSTANFRTLYRQVDLYVLAMRVVTARVVTARMVTARVLVVLSCSFTSQIETGMILT